MSILVAGMLAISCHSLAWKTIPVVTGLEEPVFVTAMPQKYNWVIVEQAGRLREWDGKRLVTFLDIRDRVKSGGEMGLLSVAFHPHYAKNGRYFVYYTRQNATSPIQIVVSEFTTASSSERIVLTVSKRYTNHNGGQLVFGPDGYLYIGTGDGGSAGDPHRNAQNLTSLLGKILRVSVDKIPYGIPDDNPFRKNGAPEIYAWGLRNPWRFSFDRITGTLWAADVGQFRAEEIDRIEKSKNYGWNVLEGTHCFLSPERCLREGMEPPVLEYGRQDGYSITGGYVYRGKRFPELYGRYVFGDYGSGKIWSMPTSGKKKSLLINTKHSISSFGEDTDGEILVVAHEGVIYRITAE